jgi:hypothetical protein
MSNPLKLPSKFVLTIALFAIFVLCLWLLSVPLETSVILLFLFPILLIVFGKMGELVIRALELVATGPLSLTNIKSTFLLMIYYTTFSVFLAFLIENSVILSAIGFQPNEWQVAIISLSLAFLPRVLSYASGMERSRNIILAILTPLTLAAAMTIFLQPSAPIFSIQTLKICFVGSLILPIIGDLTLFLFGSSGFVHPVITFETISLLDMNRLVNSQLETLKWENICDILKKAKKANRSDIIQKIVEAMTSFIKESRRRGAKYCRIIFIDDLTTALSSDPNLAQELLPVLRSFNKDTEVDVRNRIVASYALMSKSLPDQSLSSISDLLADKELTVLESIGSAFTILLRSKPEAAKYIVQLSLNTVFLDWLMGQVKERQINPMLKRSKGRIQHAELERMEKIYFQESIQDIYTKGIPVYSVETTGTSFTVSPGENPILRSLKAAYVSSPDLIAEHIQSCCASKDKKLRILAGVIVSDEEFAKSDDSFLKVKEKIKKDEDELVRGSLDFTHYLMIPQRFYSH